MATSSNSDADCGFLCIRDCGVKDGVHVMIDASFTAGIPASANLKQMRDRGWTSLTQLKTNRKVDIGPPRLSSAVAAIPAEGAVVHLEGFGAIRLLKVVYRDGDVECWATNDLTMDATRFCRRSDVCYTERLRMGIGERRHSPASAWMGGARKRFLRRAPYMLDIP